MNFPDCIRLNELETYLPLSKTAEENLETLYRNQHKIFVCAVSGDLGQNSSAYGYAAKREKDRFIRSVGLREGQVPKLEGAIEEIRTTLWQDRTELAIRINDARQAKARTESVRFDRQHEFKAWGGGMAGFIIAGGGAFLLKLNPLAALATCLIGAGFGVILGDRLAEKVAYQQSLEDQGGLLELWKEGSKDAPLTQEIFDQLEETDEAAGRDLDNLGALNLK